MTDVTPKIPKIAVLFYSATGNVAALAEAVGQGAREEGAQERKSVV